MDAELRRRLPAGAAVEDGAQGRQPFPDRRRPPGEQRLEQRGRLEPVVGHRAQSREEPVGRQPVRARDARRLGKPVRGLQRRPGRGLLHRARGGLVERPREGDGAAEERRDALRDPHADRVVRLERGDRPELEALARAAQRQPARREPEAQLLAHLLAGPAAVRWLGLAGHQHDPWRPVRGQRLAPGRLVAGAANLRLQHELQGQHGRDPLGRDRLEVVRRPVAEQDEPAGRRRLAGGARQRDAPAGAERTRQVARDGRSGARDVSGSVDRQRVRALALDDDGPPEERADRGGESVEAVAGHREGGEVALETRGEALELAPAVDEEADQASLEHRRVRAVDAERRDPGFDRGLAELLGHVRGRPRRHEQQGRRAAPRERLDEVPNVGRRRRHHREGRRRHDHDVGGLEDVEGRDPRAQDADPADRRGVGAARDRRADRGGARRERVDDLGERRHPGPAPLPPARLAATRSSSSRPNSRPAST